MRIIHFFYDIRLAMNCDYSKALLSISIAMHMRIFNTIRIYLENQQSNNSIILDAIKVGDLLYYIESQSIIRDLTFYFILIVAATIPIFTIVCYFIRKNDKQEIPNYLKSLANMYTILCWTFQYPIEYQLILYLINQDKIFFQILAAFGIVIYRVCLNLYTYLISSDQYQKKDFLNINNKTSLSLWFLLNLPIVVMNTYDFGQYKVLLHIMSFCVLYAYEIYIKNVTLFGDYHINEFFTKFLGIFSSVLLSVVLDSIYVEYMNGNSSIIYFIIIILTLKNSFKTEIDYERMLKLNTSSYNELKLKIFYLEHIIDDGKHIIIYESLYFRHYNTKCQSHLLKQINKCFCNSPQIFYAKRQQDSSTSQSLLIKNRSIFYKFIIKIWFQDYLLNNPNHLQARLDYAKFLFYKLRASNDSLLQLRQIRSKNPVIRYQIMTLHKTIEEFFYRNNQQSFSSNLDFQNVLELESQFCTIQNQIYQVLELRLKFWKLLTKDKIFYDDLMEIFEQIKSKIDDCQKHWKAVIQFKTTENNQISYVSKLDKRKRWRLLHCWYVQNILYKKLTQAMIDHFSNSVIDIKNQFEDDQLTEDSDQDQDFQNINDKICYTQHSMVFQTSGNQECSILNANNEAVALLGYTKNELKQMNIYVMIPQIQQRNHQESLRQFYQTGRSRCLYKKCKVFCVNRKGILIKSSKYLKLIINPMMQIEYICMIRPIIKSQYQYIILNELWEVQALSRSLSAIIPDIGFCFFLVCQKSLLFSQYIKYLRPSDIEKFGLQKKSSGSNLRDKDRDSDMNIRNTEIQINYQSLIFDRQSKGLIQSYALIDDDQSVFVGNQDRLINVQDGELLVLKLRMSKNHSQMVSEYKKRKINYPNLNLKNQRLIHYNDKNQIRLIKHRVCRQVRLFKEIMIQEHLDFLKQLQYQYLNDSHSIDRIFKIELKLKFDERRILDRGIVLQIGRMDLIWTDKKTEVTLRKAKKEQTQSFVNMISNISGLNSPRGASQYDDINYQEYFLETNRNPLNSLISDEQMIVDFKQEQSMKFVVNEKSLIIKEDNNKASKSFQRLQLLKILNRTFVSIQILIILISFLVGFKQQYYNFVYNFGGFYTSQMFRITLTTIQTYSTAIDIVLFNANLTQDILLNSKLAQVNTIEEWYNQTHKELDDQFNYIMYDLYGDPYFLKMFYGFSVSYSDEANVIDILDNFENNQVMLYSTPFEIIDNTSIIIMFFRHFMVPLWYKSTQLTIANLIDQSRLQLTLYRNIIVTILTFFIIFATFVFGITIGLLITLNSQVDTIYNQIFIIEPQYIEDQLKQEYKLIKCLIYIMEIMNNEVNKDEEKSTPQLKNKKDYINEDGQLKQKQRKIVNSNKLLKKKIRNLLIFIFSFIILITTPIVYFSDQFLLSQIIEQMYLDNNFIYHTDHIWVLILGTEVYLQKYQYTSYVDSGDYTEAMKKFQQSMEFDDMFQSSIESVSQLSYSEFCPDDLCKSYLNGVSKGGLRNYNLLLNQLLLSILNEDPRYEAPTLYRIYEFNLMQKYVFDVYLLQWALWTEQFEALVISTVNQELSLVIISLILSIFCFVCFFELLLFKRLNQKYVNVRYFYKKFIPNEVVSNQKRIRAQLILCGLIKK